MKMRKKTIPDFVLFAFCYVLILKDISRLFERRINSLLLNLCKNLHRLPMPVTTPTQRFHHYRFCDRLAVPCCTSP